jgi:cell division transport system permease protein
MVAATAATVVLAARAALDTHRSTIEVLHFMGATDVQVARLFQRRIALDALFGGLVGFILAALVLIGIGQSGRALGSELLGSASVPAPAWGILVGLPLFGVLLAMLVARLTILGPGADAVIRWTIRIVRDPAGYLCDRLRRCSR